MLKVQSLELKYVERELFHLYIKSPPTHHQKTIQTSFHFKINNVCREKVNKLCKLSIGELK